jgi:hypothetical protein
MIFTVSLPVEFQWFSDTGQYTRTGACPAIALAWGFGDGRLKSSVS